MCGLIYAHSFLGNPVNNEILNQFDKQKHRGTKGFGLFDGSKLHIVRSAGEKKILNWLCRYDSELIMFHHRAPTSTINVKRAAHPFATKTFFGNTQYILIHNGHISNSKILKPQHEKLGIKYHSELHDGTFNDSESLLWEFALVMEGRKEKMECYGGIAFICVKLVDGKLHSLFFGRNTNPLTFIQDDTGVMLSSEGDGDMVLSQKLYTYDYVTKLVTYTDFAIKWSNYDYNAHRTPTAVRNPNYHFNSDHYDKKYGGSAKQLGMGFRGGEEEDGDIERDIRYTIDQFDREATIERIAELYSGKRQNKKFRKKVKKIAMDYLDRTFGNFEYAYWLVERDYEELLEDNSVGAEKEQLQLEGVMEYIESDPEYTNQHSISSKYLKWREYHGKK